MDLCQDVSYERFSTVDMRPQGLGRRCSINSLPLNSLRCVASLAKDLVKATAFVPMVRRSAGYLVEGKYHDLV
jgi:nucleoside phosphorylase